MKLPEYRQFIKTTWSGIGFDLTHLVLGMASENIEYELAKPDSEEEKKELGDLFYYIFQTHNIYCIDSEYVESCFQQFGEPLLYEKGQHALETMITVTKRHLHYAEDFNLVQFEASLKAFTASLTSRMYRQEFYDILSLNHKKLSKRYASGAFSSQEAKDRADGDPLNYSDKIKAPITRPATGEKL